MTAPLKTPELPAEVAGQSLRAVTGYAAEVQWLTTAPHQNPRKWKTCEVDCGQRGWKTHAVLAADKETLEQVGRRRALCGLKPAHGWGVDLFIEAKCERCEAMIAKRHTVPMSEPPTKTP